MHCVGLLLHIDVYAPLIDRLTAQTFTRPELTDDETAGMSVEDQHGESW